ncbi:MAG: amino acid permease [Verrucomicrobiae bacterium]|nr:amino acid permease [Verrucomicrobiae bacterium]
MYSGRPPGTADRSRAGLIPTLGLFSTIMLVVGGVIGSGIFRKTGVMAAELGSPQWLMFIWILAGVITLFGALTNAEIASLIPETGGQYIYFERMYGPFFAYLYGWALFSIIQCGSIAAVAYLFAEYAGVLMPLPQLPAELAAWSFHLPYIGNLQPLAEIGTKGLAALLIVLLTIVNYLGIRFGGLVQNIFTVAKVAAMLWLAGGAFLAPSVGGLTNLTTADPSVTRHGLAWIGALAAALQGAFWAYDGWNKLTYIAGEVKSPQRNIPRALFWGMLTVTAIYALINLAYLYVLPVSELAQAKKYFAFVVAEKIVAGGGNWIAALIMLSTFGTANAIIMATARVYFSMARLNVFPRFIGRTHPRFRTPAAALVVQGIWSVLLLFSGTFDTLTDTLIFVTWAFYAAGAYGVFILRRKLPDVERPYRVPGYPIVPIIFILFAVTFLGFTAYNDFAVYQQASAAGETAIMNSLFGVGLVLIGTPGYFFFRRHHA